MTDDDRSSRPCPGPAAFHDDPDEPPRTPRAICDHCRAQLLHALEDLPALYVDLWIALQPGRRGTTQKVRGSKTAPLPLDTAPHDLMRDIADVLASWADTVRALAQLSDPPPRTVTGTYPQPPRVRGKTITLHADHPPGLQLEETITGTPLYARTAPADGVTGTTVTAAVAVLAAHVDALIALPPTPVSRRISVDQLAALPDEALGQTMAGGGIVVVDLDGAQAALEILGLKHRARRLLGQTRGKDRLPATCPLLDCGAAALVRWHGADQVQCEACGATWPEGDYQRLVLVLASEERQKQRRRKI